jgi:hypothetical protein
MSAHPLPSEQELLNAAYAAFNARDVDAALATLHPEVDWQNGWEGGRVRGHAAVRAYWRRQWESISPHVTPTRFSTDERGRTVVEAHSVVRDRSGQVAFDGMITHIFTLEGGLIRRMDILQP